MGAGLLFPPKLGQKAFADAVCRALEVVWREGAEALLGGGFRLLKSEKVNDSGSTGFGFWGKKLLAWLEGWKSGLEPFGIVLNLL